MFRSSITLRDILTAGALVTSVAALANSGTWIAGTGQAEGISQREPRITERFDPRPVEELNAGDRLKDRRFGRVEVREFALVDGEGHERASLNIDGGDVVRLRIGSDKGRETCLLSVFPDGRAAFLLKDDRNRNRATIAVAEDGRPFLSLDECGAITLDDERGRHRLVFRVDDGGEPAVTIKDRSPVLK
jgi:hypothetical protein